MVTKKYCSRCKVTLEDTEGILYAKSTGKNGILHKYYMCRKCNANRAKKYRNTESGRERIVEALKRSVVANREKVNARAILNYYVRSGMVNKPKKCEGCGLVHRLQGHHYDYSVPLEVIWVCQGCHADIHRAMQVTK